MAKLPRDDRHEVQGKYLRFAGVGIQFALTILVLTLLGTWLDDRFGTEPLFTLLLLLVGFVGATYSLIREVLPSEKPGPRP